jgi:hypothetical protein
MSSEQELRTVLSPLLSRKEHAIWITENSYVRLETHRTVDHQHERHFVFSLTETHKQHYILSIHASTLEDSLICLDYLVGLKDAHFEEISLTYKDHAMQVRLCPFGANTLEKMIQNSARRIRFNKLIFTPDHCRTLASSGTKTDIFFYQCQFQDGGAAFVEASAALQGETSGPAKLHIFGRRNILFNARYLSLFLSQHKLDSLELANINLKSEVSCRAVATAEVRCLSLGYCRLEDEGASLIESVRHGRGPKELSFSNGHPFGSTESFVTFMNALRGDEHLKQLKLPMIYDQQVTQALVAALHENKGLVHLTVSFPVLDDSDRTELLDAISLHPSLCSLDLQMHSTDIDPKKRITKAVADMLSVNDRVQAVSFHNDTFDLDDWNTNVSPRLECNLYRKRFLSVQKIGEASTRAAVLARALATFSSKPRLAWMLLNQNHDIVSSYLDSAHDQVPDPARKRSRSPSLDGMSAH